jgi:hypothetical protein
MGAAGNNKHTDRTASSSADYTFSAANRKRQASHVVGDDNNNNNNNLEEKAGDSTSNNNRYLFGSKPIADLFPRATVLFADISGFTAWSSTREPTQVFTLLEHVYNAIDIIARRRGVFKVETIGDCYMAATGLPEPRSDHAPAMCRFAREAILKMDHVVKKLEIVLYVYYLSPAPKWGGGESTEQ